MSRKIVLYKLTLLHIIITKVLYCNIENIMIQSFYFFVKLMRDFHALVSMFLFYSLLKEPAHEVGGSEGEKLTLFFSWINSFFRYDKVFFILFHPV